MYKVKLGKEENKRGGVMNIDTEKYKEYKKALQFIKDAKPSNYKTFSQMVKVLQDKASKVL